jgi:membrane protein
VPTVPTAARLADARRRLDATFAGRFARELLELRVIDRALALASKCFIAVLPLTILSTAVVSDRGFGDELVRRFGLTGSGATAARELFAAPTQVEASIGALGFVILISSVMSFSRALERVYLDCWRLPALASGTGRRLLWLAGLVLALAVLSATRSRWVDPDTPLIQWVTGTVVAGLFFLWTPYLLLGRRVRPRRLLPTAVLSGAGALALGIGSTIALPRYISHDTERYGLIGFTFAIVSYLFAASLLVVGAAALGAMLDRRARGVEDVAAPPDDEE